MRRAVLVMVFDDDFSFSNDIARDGPDMVRISEIWAHILGLFFMIWCEALFFRERLRRIWGAALDLGGRHGYL